MNSLAVLRSPRERTEPLGGFGRWLRALPHPDLVCRIAPDRVAAARWGSHRLEAFAEEALPAGTLNPSPSQANFAQPEAVGKAVAKVVERVRGARREVALLVPDVIVRIFLLSFDTFPRKAAEAAPLLRWRLRKSVPFPVEETALSWTEQRSSDGSLEVVTAVARESVVGEYEQALRGAGLEPGVVLGESLATLPLVEEGQAVLVLRLAGASLTTAIADAGRLALYRCGNLGAAPDARALLDEIFPAIAFFQDRTHRNIGRVRLAGMEGLGSSLDRRLEQELGCPVGPLAGGDAPPLPEGAAELFSKQQEPLVGWHLNRGA